MFVFSGETAMLWFDFGRLWLYGVACCVAGAVVVVVVVVVLLACSCVHVLHKSSLKYEPPSQ